MLLGCSLQSIARWKTTTEPATCVLTLANRLKGRAGFNGSESETVVGSSWNTVPTEGRFMTIRRWLGCPGSLSWSPILIVSVLLASPTPLSGQENRYVGGHVGFGFPLVTKDGGNVSSLADNFYMGLPVAITVNGPGRMYFDLEFVPYVVDKPREIQLVINPGFLWRLGHGFAAGSRVAFLVNSDQTKSAQFGITPLVVKSWPIEHSFFKGYFVEGDFIFRFNRPPNGPATNPFTFQVVLGLSF